jgi:LuxR family maltose regulon positive regulatory protein
MVAAHPLLATKLYIPLWRSRWVSRPRLLDRLNQGFKGKLTLVSAPAGFGKTTLLAEWVAAVPTRSVAWVSLDPSDNDPAVFWTYLISALQTFNPSWVGDRSRYCNHRNPLPLSRS